MGSNLPEGNNINNASIASPLSSTPPIHIRNITCELIISKTNAYFDSNIPISNFNNYALWKCSETGLEFSWPPIPGDEEYYKWLGSQAKYYPNERWEWGIVSGRLNISDKIADIGGGDGKFAQFLGERFKSNLRIIDLSNSAVHNCKRLGYTADCLDICNIRQRSDLYFEAYDVITCFHCLEHVPDPLLFLKSLSNLLKPTGTLYISTPLSPMHFECIWFDILNYPPHHMTRWNSRSFIRLAEINNLDIELIHEPAASFISRCAITFRLSKIGVNCKITKFYLLLNMIVCPILTIKILYHQLFISRYNGKIVGNSILAIFRKRQINKGIS